MIEIQCDAGWVGESGEREKDECVAYCEDKNIKGRILTRVAVNLKVLR